MTLDELQARWTIRVLIADDHAPTLVGIREALENAGMQVVAQVTNGPDAVLAAVRTTPDVVLLDVDMAGGGIEAAGQIVREVPGTAVVMLSDDARDQDLFAALKAGARGFLLKDTDPDRLPFALEGVMKGEAALPRTLMARLIDEFRGPLTGPTGQRLSEREQEVLQLMADDLSTGQMADRLAISAVTVRRHVSALVKKLGVADRAAAVAQRSGSATGAKARSSVSSRPSGSTSVT
jgi:DNA-binding NarL/FixJ family response regulator